MIPPHSKDKKFLRVIRDEGLSSEGDIANRMGIQESALEGILSPFIKRLPKTIDSTEKTPRGCIGCPVSKERVLLLVACTLLLRKERITWRRIILRFRFTVDVNVNGWKSRRFNWKLS